MDMCISVATALFWQLVVGLLSVLGVRRGLARVARVEKCTNYFLLKQPLSQFALFYIVDTGSV